MQTNKRADVCEHDIQQLSDEKTSKLKQEKKTLPLRQASEHIRGMNMEMCSGGKVTLH